MVLDALDGVDVSQIQIPLGSLVDLDLLWGLGPTMKVHAMTVGTVEGEFQKPVLLRRGEPDPPQDRPGACGPSDPHAPRRSGGGGVRDPDPHR